jgi:hypothetical protein
MTPTMDTLLEQLLLQTLHLEKIVGDDSIPVEEWLAVVQDREETIQNIDLLVANGEPISVEHKQTYLRKIFEIDQRIGPVMLKKKRQAQEKWLKLQRSKQASQTYSSSVNAYGAFFDKKK